jgi:hypothetical protein
VTAASDWPRRGRWWLAVGQAACLATIVLAGRAGAERPATGGQGKWLAIAITAALLSAAGNGVWLAVLRRAATIRRRAVVTRLGAGAGRAGRRSALGPSGVVADRRVMVPGLTLHHRPGCALVAGKAVVPAGAGTRPCGWCEP